MHHLIPYVLGALAILLSFRIRRRFNKRTLANIVLTIGIIALFSASGLLLRVVEHYNPSLAFIVQGSEEMQQAKKHHSSLSAQKALRYFQQALAYDLEHHKDNKRLIHGDRAMIKQAEKALNTFSKQPNMLTSQPS